MSKSQMISEHRDLPIQSIQDVLDQREFNEGPSYGAYIFNESSGGGSSIKLKSHHRLGSKFLNWMRKDWRH